MAEKSDLPLIESTEDLDDVLTRPRAELREAITELRSPLVILGAGGTGNPGAGLSPAYGNRPTDTTSGAGYQGDFVV